METSFLLRQYLNGYTVTLLYQTCCSRHGRLRGWPSSTLATTFPPSTRLKGNNLLQNPLFKSQDTAFESFLTYLQEVAINQLQLAGKEKLRQFGPFASSMGIICELMGNADPRVHLRSTELEPAFDKILGCMLCTR